MRWVTVFLGLTTCVTLTYFFPGAAVSPGKLRKGHESLTNECLPCHEPFGKTPSSKCVACHSIEKIGTSTVGEKPLAKATVVEGSAKERIPFHAHLSEQECLPCHSDHGREVKDPKFAHAFLKPEVQPQCVLCHRLPKDPAHVRVVSSCDACHTLKEWSPATCDHRRYFLFDRNHDSKCISCHPDGNYRKYTCYGCHDHSPAKMRSEHREARITELDKCADCHRSSNMSEAKRIWRAIRDRARNTTAP